MHALASEARAEESEATCACGEGNADLQLANSLVAQGDVLSDLDKWSAARANYEAAEGMFRKLRVPTTTAEMGLWNAYAVHLRR